MNSLIILFLFQLSFLTIGVFAGLLTSWLASEELQEYKKITGRLMMISFILTLLSPLFFVEKWIPVVFIAVSWGVIAFPQKNEEQIFFMLSPLTLFLATQNKDAFFVSSVCFFIAVGLTTMKACSSFVKENMLQLRKELFMEILRHKLWFIGISVLVYVGASLYSL